MSAAHTGHFSTKRRRLSGPFSSFSKSSSSSNPASSASSSRHFPLSRASSSARTPFDDEEYAKARHQSAVRVLNIWSSLEERYAKAIDEDDIVDLRSGKLVQDRGVLKRMDKPRHYGGLLAGDDDKGEEDEDDEDGTTTDYRDDTEAAEEEDEGEEEYDEADDSLRLRSGPGEGDTSEDELGEWDTVPAPPSDEDEEPSKSPPPVPRPKVKQLPKDAFSFLHSDVRPKLEKLAREREQSPLPEEDLAAFMAAESQLKARPGYVEPHPEPPTTDDEIEFLGYGTTATSEADGPDSEYATEQEYEGQDEVEEDREDENTEDELDDWSTVPAPADYYQSDSELEGEQVPSALESDVTHVSDSQEPPIADSSDAEDIEATPARGVTSRSPSPALQPPKPSPKKQSMVNNQPRSATPPYSKTSTVFTKSVSPHLQKPLKAPESERTTTSPIKRSRTAPSLSPIKKGPPIKAIKSAIKEAPPHRTPSFTLVPEVVVPTVASLSIKIAPRTPSRSKSPAKPATEKLVVEVSSRKRKRLVVESDPEESGDGQVLEERMGSLGLQDEDSTEQDTIPERSVSPPADAYSEPGPSKPRHRTPWPVVETEEEEEEENTSGHPTEPGPSAPRSPGVDAYPGPNYPPPPQTLQPQAVPSYLGQGYGHVSPHQHYGPPTQHYSVQPPPPPAPVPFAPALPHWNFQFAGGHMPVHPIFVQPQPTPAPTSSNQDALLTQVLYSLNYLAYRNGAPGNAPLPPTQFQQPPYQQPTAYGTAPVQYSGAPPWAFNPSPHTPERMPSTPVESMSSRQPQPYDYEEPRSRSILRVGGQRGPDLHVRTASPVERRSSGLGLIPDPKGKGKAVSREEPLSPTEELRRGMSVTFNNPPSAATPKGQYSPIAESPRFSKSLPSINAAPPRPSPLRKVTSSSSEDTVAPSPSPTKQRSSRSGPIPTTQSMGNLDHLRRSSGDSNSAAVLAKARAALSSSVATTESLARATESRKQRR